MSNYFHKNARYFICKTFKLKITRSFISESTFASKLKIIEKQNFNIAEEV